MQSSFFRKPHQVLWIAIPVILAITLFSKAETIDIQMHDNYLVITPFHMGLLFGGFLAFLGGIYWLLRHRKLLGGLTATHLALTLAGVLLLAIRLSAPHFFAPKSDDWQMVLASRREGFYITLLAILGLGLAQILFFVNMGLSKKRA